MADPNYIPESERQPAHHDKMNIMPFESNQYYYFPNIEMIHTLEVFNSQKHSVDIEFNFNNGKLSITLIEPNTEF